MQGPGDLHWAVVFSVAGMLAGISRMAVLIAGDKKLDKRYLCGSVLVSTLIGVGGAMIWAQWTQDNVFWCWAIALWSGLLQTNPKEAFQWIQKTAFKLIKNGDLNGDQQSG